MVAIDRGAYLRNRSYIENQYQNKGGIMCLILFAYDCHPKYKLVVAANRDEFYNRPALPAAFWPDNPFILAGKDLQQGGTWMGITTSGRFAALTNYRDPSHYNPQSPSRGYLVQNYLNSNAAPESYIENLDNGGAEYNGFNLLVGNYDTLYYYSNQEKIIKKVEKGIHGLSNSLLDVEWPKVSKGKRALASCMQQQDIKVECLLEIMANMEQPEDCELPQTGVSLEWERMLAPTYVMSENYGTKLTTVLMVDRKNNIKFWERSFTPIQLGTWNDVHYEIKGQ
jgi:uncharacterized protein with NRDE domain